MLFVAIFLFAFAWYIKSNIEINDPDEQGEILRGCVVMNAMGGLFLGIWLGMNF
jgi:hypothetical protein